MWFMYYEWWSLWQALCFLYLNWLFLLRAADWKLDAPDWTGRLRVVAKGKEICIKLEDKMSGCVTIIFSNFFLFLAPLSAPLNGRSHWIWIPLINPTNNYTKATVCYQEKFTKMAAKVAEIGHFEKNHQILKIPKPKCVSWHTVQLWFFEPRAPPHTFSLVSPPQRAERLIWSLWCTYGCCLAYMFVATYEISKISSDIKNSKTRTCFMLFWETFFFHPLPPRWNNTRFGLMCVRNRTFFKKKFKTF